MRVTPRLPTHGAYSLSPFLEMRYFRFADSSLPLALLFALVEHSSFPHSQRNQWLIQEMAQKCTDPARRLIDMSLDRKVEASYILTVWNNAETAIIEALNVFGLFGVTVEEVRESWQERYNVQVVRWGNEEAKRAEMTQVYWDYYNDSIVLLYSHYTMDSFLISPCDHVYLKTELYRRTREAMKRPMTKEEIANVTIKCYGDRCKQDIQLFAFNKGKEDTETINAKRCRNVGEYLQNGGKLEKFHIS